MTPTPTDKGAATPDALTEKKRCLAAVEAYDRNARIVGASPCDPGLMVLALIAYDRASAPPQPCAPVITREVIGVINLREMAAFLRSSAPLHVIPKREESSDQVRAALEFCASELDKLAQCASPTAGHAVEADEPRNPDDLRAAAERARKFLADSVKVYEQQSEDEAGGYASAWDQDADDIVAELSIALAPNPEYPECSGDPACCPENEGYGRCKPNPNDPPGADAGEAAILPTNEQLQAKYRDGGQLSKLDHFLMTWCPSVDDAFATEAFNSDLRAVLSDLASPPHPSATNNVSHPAVRDPTYDDAKRALDKFDQVCAKDPSTPYVTAQLIAMNSIHAVIAEAGVAK